MSLEQTRTQLPAELASELRRPTPCKQCGQPRTWIKTYKGFRPFNPDGSPHHCPAPPGDCSPSMDPREANPRIRFKTKNKDVFTKRPESGYPAPAP